MYLLEISYKIEAQNNIGFQTWEYNLLNKTLLFRL